MRLGVQIHIPARWREGIRGWAGRLGEALAHHADAGFSDPVSQSRKRGGGA